MKLSDILSSFHQRWETCQLLTGSSKQITERFKTGDVTRDLASGQAPAAHSSRHNPSSTAQHQPRWCWPVPRAPRSAGMKCSQPRHLPLAAHSEALLFPHKACLPSRGGRALGNQSAMFCSILSPSSCGAPRPQYLAIPAWSCQSPHPCCSTLLLCSPVLHRASEVFLQADFDTWDCLASIPRDWTPQSRFLAFPE